MSERLAKAIQHRPFSNGTEGYTWMGNWCDHCARDHACHDPGGDHSKGCDLILLAMLPDFPCEDFPWPEAWLPEPDDGKFQLPSRLSCAAFSPCTEGTCEGDPYSEIRAEQVAEVTAYWRAPTQPKEAHDE